MAPTRTDRPRLVGDGPVTFSTSLDLVLRPIWDVNRYYADLGVGVRATKGQISRAYHRSSRDAHLTYVVKQLLDPAVRRAYDLCDQGTVFLDDEVRARLRQALTPGVSVGAGRLPHSTESPDAALGSFDNEPSDHQDAVCTDDWSFAHYLWQTTTVDLDLMHRWLRLVVSEVGRQGIRTQISVGLSGGTRAPVEVAKVGARTVVFLHEQHDPHDASVRQAVSRLPDFSSISLIDRKIPMAQPTFRTGAEAAQEASKAGAQFARTQYFSIEDGQSAILRFLTDKDAWIVVDQHQNVPTRTKPSDYPSEARWPEKMAAVCRKDRAFEGMYSDCFICDHLVDGKNVRKPSARNWAYAVLREEVIENGQVVGYRDKTREIAVTDKDGKATGETKTEKAIVVVNMGFKNFFSILSGFGNHYKTVLDRDYVVKRSGTNTDTTYQIIPLDPIQIGDKVFDLRNPEFMARYEPAETLPDVVMGRASDEFYARFFDTRVAQPSHKQGDSTSTASQGAPATPPQAASSEPDSAALAQMAARVRGYGSSPDAQAGAAAEAAPANDTPASTETPATAAPGGGMRDFG